MIYFITNRQINPDGTIRPDGKETAEAVGDNLRFGSYDISTKEFNVFPEPQTDADLDYAKATSNIEINSQNIELKGSTRFFTDLYKAFTANTVINSSGIEESDTLFFIHGFNTNLKKLQDTIDNLHKKYVENPNSPIGHLLIFTWPGRSPAVPYHYHDDKKDAIRSGEALARGIIKALKFLRKTLVQERNPACNKKIHLMAHSMGNRVLEHTMKELIKENVGIPELFDQILLMAPDVEYNIFEPQEAFYQLIDFGRRVHIYYHDKDHVLSISKYTKNFSNRLGKYGRRYVNSSLTDVFDVNVSETRDDQGVGLITNHMNHWYYYSSQMVVDDVIRVLKGDKSKYLPKS
ncbi:MAG: alpha/beta hydrolase [Raineya sp.]|jgi:esterase/lipase superfamily enzyme|nr:alpha/beta hydrolase [Raineya sp.]